MAGNKNSGTSRASGSEAQSVQSAQAESTSANSTQATNDTAATGKVEGNTITNAEYSGLSGSESVDAEKGGKDGDTYTVKDGDSLDTIAEETGVDRDELMRLNPEITPFTNHVYSGQELRLK